MKNLLPNLPSLLLFWFGGLVQGVAIGDPDLTAKANLIAAAIATACFALAGWRWKKV